MLKTLKSGIEVTENGLKEVKNSLGLDLAEMESGEIIYNTMTDHSIYRCEAEAERFNIVELDTTGTTELKLCPHCGSHEVNVVIKESKINSVYATSMYVECNMCKARGPLVLYTRRDNMELAGVFEKYEETIKMWNGDKMQNLKDAFEKVKETTGRVADKIEADAKIEELKELLNDVALKVTNKSDEIVESAKNSLSDFFDTLSKNLKK